jgi:hypothetical protein
MAEISTLGWRKEKYHTVIASEAKQSHKPLITDVVRGVIEIASLRSQ